MDSSEKKSFKVTNSRQFQVLVSLMQENLQLAKGLPGCGKERIAAEEAWDNIAQEVNLYGPPERMGSEWKKIWADLKSRTKRKIYENKKHASAYGDAPHRLLSLSDLEQSVDRIFQFSNTIASDELDNSLNDSSTDGVFDDLLNSYEVKIETDPSTKAVTSTESPQKSKISKVIKKSKQMPPQLLLAKRKNDKLDMQFRLLQQQVKTQEKIFKVMKMQAAATKDMADATAVQAEALTTIADSTKAIAQAVQDALKHLKREE